MKKIFLFLFFIFFDYFLYIGKQNYEFYRKNGVPKKKLISAPYFVDNNFFNQNNKKLNIKTKKKIVFIFSGKFVERKKPMDILKALNSPILKNIAINLFFR